MREIKFRAWSNKKKFYVYSDDFQGTKMWDLNMATFFNIADISVLEQYTGLKDKNGKEIYEGDIVRDYDEGYLYHVLFGEYYAQFMFYDFKNDDYYDNKDIAEHEVIGNIHETPELIDE